MANYKENYISFDEYTALQQIDLNYEGFVIGVGYAYTLDISIAPPHMGIYNPPRFVPPGMDHYMYGRMQCLDTTQEAIAKSYNYTSEEITKRITKYNIDQETITVSLGNGESITLPKSNCSINVSTKINAQEQTAKISVTNTLSGLTNVKEFNISDFDILFGDYSDQNRNLNTNNATNDDLAKISFITGCISTGYSAWAENGIDPNHYIPKKGPNAGKPTTLYKTTPKGRVVTRLGKPVPRSARALAKIRLVKWVKIGGYALNTAGIALTVYDMVVSDEITPEHLLDLTFGVIAFVPGGWIVSGIYFIGKEFISLETGPMPISNTDFREPYYHRNDKTRVELPVYDLFNPLSKYK